MDWLLGLMMAALAAGGAYAAVRVEMRFLWRDLDDLNQRVHAIEHGDRIPRRRRTDHQVRT